MTLQIRVSKIGRRLERECYEKNNYLTCARSIIFSAIAAAAILGSPEVLAHGNWLAVESSPSVRTSEGAAIVSLEVRSGLRAGGAGRL